MMRVALSLSFNCLLHCAQTWFITVKSPGFKILEVGGGQYGCDQKSPIFPFTLCRRANECRPHCRQSHRSCPERVFFDTVSKEISLGSLSYWWRRWVFNPPPQHQECRTLQIAEFASIAVFTKQEWCQRGRAYKYTYYFSKLTDIGTRMPHESLGSSRHTMGKEMPIVDRGGHTLG